MSNFPLEHFLARLEPSAGDCPEQWVALHVSGRKAIPRVLSETLVLSVQVPARHTRVFVGFLATWGSPAAGL